MKNIRSSWNSLAKKHGWKGQGSAFTFLTAHLEETKNKNAPDLRELVYGGIAVVDEVLSNWGQGDLAGAVNALEEWKDDALADMEKDDEAPIKPVITSKLTVKQYIARAREVYQDDNCEIDDVARLSKVNSGDQGAWVQAWVWVPDSDFEGVEHEPPSTD